MRAEPEEVLSRNTKRNRFPFVELLLALGVIAALVAFWFWSGEEEPVEPAAKLPEVVVPAKPPSPRQLNPRAQSQTNPRHRPRLRPQTAMPYCANNCRRPGRTPNSTLW